MGYNLAPSMPICLTAIFQRLAALLFTALVCTHTLNADGNANLTITSVPGWGQNGSLTGNVSGVDASTVKLFAFLFIPDLGWYNLNCNPIPIQGTGAFSVLISDPTTSIMNGYAT